MELLVTVRYFSLLFVVMPSLRGGRQKQWPRGRQRRIRSKSAPAVLRSPRRGKRKQWDEDAMLAALEAVRSGCSIKRAALEHGVPRITLYDRHTGRVVHGTNPGPQPYLNKAEEAELRDLSSSWDK